MLFSFINVETLQLAIFSSNFLAKHHLFTLDRLFCRTWTMSFRKIRSNNRSKLGPCVTPELTLQTLERWPLLITNHSSLVMHDSKKFKRNSQNLTADHFSKSIEWLNVSKAIGTWALTILVHSFSYILLDREQISCCRSNLHETELVSGEATIYRRINDFKSLSTILFLLRIKICWLRWDY